VFASGVWDEQSGDVILKIVNLSADVKKMIIHTEGLTPRKLKVTVQSIWSPSLTDFNSLEDQFLVSPVTRQPKIKTDKFSVTVNGNSFTVIRIPAHNQF
jgi:alpha-L-arabinofuranosidase